jgi:hypothetical protein
MSPQEEQDKAAGGAHARVLLLEDGTPARASIGLLTSKTGRAIYAYLRFKAAGTNLKRYVGGVEGSSRAERLQCAWRLVRQYEVIERSGWTWQSEQPGSDLTKPKARRRR